MKLAQATCVVLLTSLAIAPIAPAAELTSESLPQIKQNLDAGKAVLVDVRDKKEWDAGHVEGAIFLPVASLRDGITKEELAPLPKDKILYVHCVVGKRAMTAANLLEKHGYKVRPMKPGYKEMISAGFPKAKD